MKNRDDLVAVVGAEQKRILEGFTGLAGQVGPPGPPPFLGVTGRVVRHEVAAEIVLYPALRELPGGEPLAEGMVRSQSLIQGRSSAWNEGGSPPAHSSAGCATSGRWCMTRPNGTPPPWCPCWPVALSPVRGRPSDGDMSRYHDTPPHPPAPTTAAGHERTPLSADGRARRVDPRLGRARAPPGQLTRRPGQSCYQTCGPVSTKGLGRAPDATRPTVTPTPSLGGGGVGRSAVRGHEDKEAHVIPEVWSVNRPLTWTVTLYSCP